MRYTHTNIVTDDWKRLADFYESVFQCVPVPPMRDQAGDWLDRGTGLRHSHLQGMHLRLPGVGDHGPTLEIYQHAQVQGRDDPQPTSDQKGLRHLAFHVDDVAAVRDAVIAHGGSNVGELVEKEVEGLGHLTFIYVADPDGNIIELQHWG